MPSIDDLFNNFALRKTLLALRIPIALVLVAALLWNIDPHWFWPGLVVSAAGLVLQLWVFGCIRTRQVLAVNGPYMFVRNPMYIARFILILGLILMTGIPWLILVYAPLYYFYMVNRVAREEPVLQETFGKEYLDYCKHVPRFVPTFKPYRKGRFFYFREKNFYRQHGLENLAAFLLLYVACYFAAFYLNA
ncbi:MAG TPA: isoprenylcysteine carboxylmethyltransferase family protein [Arenicellales bacterium]|nr:isoprenylcysteine carboxylmethyltransferase family protein [Arenicellales bacterium]